MAAKKTTKKTAKTERAEREPAAKAQITKQSYKLVPVGALSEHPDNPRRGDEELIRQSIAQNDFYGVVVAQAGSGLILAGNHRWKAAKAAGLTKIPVVYLEVDDAKARRILLADNRASDAATYDDGALLAALQAVVAEGNQELAGTGYEPADLVQLLAASAPPPAETPKHAKRSQMKHACPQCGYEWTADPDGEAAAKKPRKTKR